MTTKEKTQLNKDIKALASEIYRMSFESNEAYFLYIDTVAKAEFNRLYRLDKTFENVSKDNVLIMFRLNLSHKFVAMHYFGLDINIKNLI